MRRVQEVQFPDDPLVHEPGVIGLAVKAARTQSGLRQDSLALLAGVALQTLSDVEQGRDGVSIGKILDITEAAGIRLFVVPRQHEAAVREFLRQLQ